MYLLGADFGTTSLKCAVFTEKGETVAEKTVDYNLDVSGSFIEFDAEKYWDLFCEGLKVSDGVSISAIAVDTQCETLIVTDENGNPLRPAIVWMDNRASEEAEIIEKEFGRKRVYEVTGQPEITATWPAAKLLWISRREPEIWKRTKKIFLLEDWLLYKMTGKFVTQKTLQSSSLYFDVNRETWWEEMLTFIGVNSGMLPEILGCGERVGEYNGAVVCTSAMDQIAGAIGAGAAGTSIINETTGTTLAVYMRTEKLPEYDKNKIVPAHKDFDGGFCLLPWTSTAGIALKWFRRELCENFSFSQLDTLAESVPKGSGGLIMLPYLCGSSMPRYNPDARGVFYGFTLEHGRGHFARCIMESVAFMLRQNIEAFGGKFFEIRSQGGGAESALWCQIKADVLDAKLITLKRKNTPCMGSAILAGAGAGVLENIRDASRAWAEPEREFLPQGGYDDIYKKYCRLDERLNVKGDWI